MLKVRIFLLAVFLLFTVNTSLFAQRKSDWKTDALYEEYVQAVELLNTEEHEKSLIFCRKLLEKAILTQDDAATGYAYNTIAANFDALSEPQKSLFYYKKALYYAEKSKNNKLLNWVFNNLGNIYCFDKKDYEKGIYYYKQSLYYSTVTKDSSQLVLTQLNIAWAYFDIKEFKKGEEYINFINQHHPKHGDATTITALKLLNGMYYNYKNDTVQAATFFKQAINEGIKNEERSDLSFTFQEYSRFLFKNKQYKEAYLTLTKYDSLNELIKIEDKLSKVNTTGINLQIDEYKRELDKIESLYRNKEELLLYEKSRNKKVIGIMISLFIISIILFYFFFQNTKLKQKSKLKDIQRKIQDNIINASIDGQESERKKIAEFLHDNISAMLSSAGMHLKVLSSTNAVVPEELIKTKSILEDAHDRVRDLSHKLLPTLLVRFGLFYAIEDLCEKNSNTNIHFEYLSTISTKTRYNEKFEMRLYFIICELFNNIAKHSDATKAQIEMTFVNHEIMILIQDNGRGFDTTKMLTLEGFGLNQIKARIKNLNGDLNIKSSSENGTSVKIRVPILY